MKALVERVLRFMLRLPLALTVTAAAPVLAAGIYSFGAEGREAIRYTRTVVRCYWSGGHM